MLNRVGETDPRIRETAPKTLGAKGGLSLLVGVVLSLTTFGTVVLGTSQADAAPATRSPQAAETRTELSKAVRIANTVPSADAPFTKLAGYKIVQAGPFNAPGGQQAEGVATCPGTEVPVGGGVLPSPVGDDNSTLFASVNSSNPDGSAWHVDVNTLASNGDAAFDVYAVCIDHTKSYSVVTSGPVDSPADSATRFTVVCPVNRVVVGGGAYSYSSSIDTYIINDYPESSSLWQVSMANTSTSDQTFVAYAICEKQPSGYSQVSTFVEVPGNSEAPLAVNCPSGSFPLSGGPYLGQNVDTGVSLTASFPSSTDWAVFMYNSDSSMSWLLYTTAVCAS
jgi:hypothetical protein